MTADCDCAPSRLCPAALARAPTHHRRASGAARPPKTYPRTTGINHTKEHSDLPNPHGRHDHHGVGRREFAIPGRCRRARLPRNARPRSTSTFRCSAPSLSTGWTAPVARWRTPNWTSATVACNWATPLRPIRSPQRIRRRLPPTPWASTARTSTRSSPRPSRPAPPSANPPKPSSVATASPRSSTRSASAGP
jgi:hypothetical protein